MKMDRFSAPEATGVPENMSSSTYVGIEAAMITNERLRESKKPVLTTVDEVPAATPLLVTGTELIMELEFGEANIPPPTPAISIGIRNTEYGTDAGILENQT